MKKLYVSENPIEVGLIKGLLDSEGIACLVKNQTLAGALGEIPPLECWPEIWITTDQDLVRAEEIVKSVRSTPVSSENWNCECGESIEGQFGSCWNCGKERVE
ncbi:MAG: DUF2007 domain-containing protein [Gammaproteobacteria bacterium]|nr:DUF2007 domain-containing protein [Gammaproteobacteria bacterium]